MALPRLHLVTDDDVLSEPAFRDTAAAILDCCGPDLALHLRGHHTSGRVLHDVAMELADMALRTGAWLLVNDRVDVAMACRANGVHLGMRCMPVPDARALLGLGAAIGCSAHSALGAGRAAAEGADFILAGTIFDSASHPERPGAGVDRITECRHAAALPVVAIGGVTVERLAEVAAAGAWGVAVLGGVWRAADPPAAAAAFVAGVQRQFGTGQHGSMT